MDGHLLSLELTGDEDYLAGDGRKSSVDNKTIYGTPAPLAASTVASGTRTDSRLKNFSLPAQAYDIDVDPADRSSLGILQLDNMPGLSGSMLEFDGGPAELAARLSFGDRRDSHTADNVSGKEVDRIPTEGREPESTPRMRETSNTTAAPGPTPTFTGGDPMGALLFGTLATASSDLDVSVKEICIDDEELDQFDEEFSDIGESDMTLTDEADKGSGFSGSLDSLPKTMHQPNISWLQTMQNAMAGMSVDDDFHQDAYSGEVGDGIQNTSGTYQWASGVQEFKRNSDMAAQWQLGEGHMRSSIPGDRLDIGDESIDRSSHVDPACRGTKPVSTMDVLQGLGFLPSTRTSNTNEQTQRHTRDTGSVGRDSLPSEIGGAVVMTTGHSPSHAERRVRFAASPVITPHDVSQESRKVSVGEDSHALDKYFMPHASMMSSQCSDVPGGWALDNSSFSLEDLRGGSAPQRFSLRQSQEEFQQNNPPIDDMFGSMPDERLVPSFGVPDERLVPSFGEDAVRTYAEEEDCPVYITEEGEGVTHLAFKFPLDQLADNPFDGMAGSHLPEGDQFNNSVDLGFDDNDFISGDQGTAMLDKDEEEFKHDNIFRQDEVMEIDPTHGDSWLAKSLFVNNDPEDRCQLISPFEMSSPDKEQLYMRISIGTFIKSRTEELGSLEGNKAAPRPSFGTNIVTPPGNRQPVVLISQPPSPTDFTPATTPQQDPVSDPVHGSHTSSDHHQGVGIDHVEVTDGAGQQDLTLRPEDLNTSTSTPTASHIEDSVTPVSTLVRAGRQDTARPQTVVRPKAKQLDSLQKKLTFSQSQQSQKDASFNDSSQVLRSGAESPLINDTSVLLPDGSILDLSKVGLTADSVMEGGELNLSAIVRLISEAPANAQSDELASLIMRMSQSQDTARNSSRERRQAVIEAQRYSSDSSDADSAMKERVQKMEKQRTSQSAGQQRQSFDRGPNVLQSNQIRKSGDGKSARPKPGTRGSSIAMISSSTPKPTSTAVSSAAHAGRRSHDARSSIGVVKPRSQVKPYTSGSAQTPPTNDSRPHQQSFDVLSRPGGVGRLSQGERGKHLGAEKPSPINSQQLYTNKGNNVRSCSKPDSNGAQTSKTYQPSRASAGQSRQTGPEARASDIDNTKGRASMGKAVNGTRHIKNETKAKMQSPTFTDSFFKEEFNRSESDFTKRNDRRMSSNDFGEPLSMNQLGTDKDREDRGNLWKEEGIEEAQDLENVPMVWKSPRPSSVLTRSQRHETDKWKAQKRPDVIVEAATPTAHEMSQMHGQNANSTNLYQGRKVQSKILQNGSSQDVESEDSQTAQEEGESNTEDSFSVESPSGINGESARTEPNEAHDRTLPLDRPADLGTEEAEFQQLQWQLQQQIHQQLEIQRQMHLQQKPYQPLDSFRPNLQAKQPGNGSLKTGEKNPAMLTLPSLSSTPFGACLPRDMPFQHSLMQSSVAGAGFSPGASLYNMTGLSTGPLADSVMSPHEHQAGHDNRMGCIPEESASAINMLKDSPNHRAITPGPFGRDSIPGFPSNQSTPGFPSNQSTPLNPTLNATVWKQLTAERMSMGSESFMQGPEGYCHYSSSAPAGFLSLPQVHSGEGSYLIETPLEVRIPHVCCVGLSTQGMLPIHNPSGRWLSVSLRTVSISMDGNDQDPTGMSPFVFSEKVIVGPGKSEEHPVVFAPRQAGAYVAQLHLVATPVASDLPLRQPNQVPAMVTLQGLAEKPLVQVVAEGGTANILDFGALPWGSRKGMTLRLVNMGRASIPLRLVISTKKCGWSSFTFEADHCHNASLTSMDGQRDFRPPILNLTLPGCDDTAEDAQPVCATIYFTSRPKDMNRMVLGTPEEAVGRVDVQLDTPAHPYCLATATLMATVGTARLHAPRDMEVVHLRGAVGRSCSKVVPLRNAGNIPVEVSFEVTEHNDIFSVVPMGVMIEPGGESQVSIRFQPKNMTGRRQSLLLMFVEPDGPGYEIQMYGEVGQPPPPTAAQSTFKLFSNQDFLVWGGVATGTSEQKMLKLKNTGDKMMKLRLEMKGKCDDFKLKSSFGSVERLADSKEIIIQPMTEYPVHVIFTPTRMAPLEAKLQIRPTANNNYHRFMIPLLGHGGSSKVVIENLDKDQANSWYTSIGHPESGTKVAIRPVIKNKGKRAAFVKLMAFEDLRCSSQLFDSKVYIEPSEICLGPYQSKEVLVKFFATDKDTAMCMCMDSAAVVAVIACYSGNEFSRQKFRRAHRKNPGKAAALLEKTSPLRGINFDVHYNDEETVVEDVTRDTEKDIKLFYSSMTKMTVAIVGEPPRPESFSGVSAKCPGATSALDTHPRALTSTSPHLDWQQPSKALLQSNMDSKEESHLKNHLSQLKEQLQGLPDRTEAHSPASRDQSPGGYGAVPKDLPTKSSSSGEDLWAIQPEHIILHLSPSEAKPELTRMQITNYADSPMRFELSWPAHCITVTPEQGLIPARSFELLYVSPSPNVTKRGIQLPWCGQVHITCGQQAKVLRVQIRAAAGSEDGSHWKSNEAGSMSAPMAAVRQANDSPVLITCTPLEVKFPATQTTHTETQKLELTNISPYPVKWVLTSFAAPYLKGADRESSVFRLTYSAFWFPTVSGLLQPKTSEQVVVHFRPREVGQYSQFWEVKAETQATPTASVHKCKVQLMGQGVDIAFKEPAPVGGPTNTRPTAASNSGAVNGGTLLLISPENILFPKTNVGASNTCRLEIKNKENKAMAVTLVRPKPPFFYTKNIKTMLKPRHYVRLPIEFRPTKTGSYHGMLLLRTESGDVFTVNLTGNA